MQDPATNTPRITIPTLNLSRRHFIVGGLASALLMACGDSSDDAPADSSTPEATTRVVETDKGPITVPANPQRVVVFDRRGTLAYMLDLGIKPIAAFAAPDIYGGKSFHPLAEAEAGNIAKINATEPDIEQVAGLQPDLIVGNAGDVNKVWDQLTAIAPTIPYTIDYNNPELELIMLGKVFGMEEKAAKLLADFDADVAKAKTALKSPGSVSLILPTADNVRVYNGANLAGQIVTGLGGTVTPDIIPLGPAVGGQHANVSYEQVSVINGDMIVIFANTGQEWIDNTKKLMAMPVFQSLASVKANRVIEVDSQSNFGSGGLKGQRAILVALQKAFA